MNTIYSQFIMASNGFLGIITELSQVFLAIYDTGISSHTYTGSGNIDITYNQISLKFPIQITDGIVLNPMLNVCFELHAGASGFAFLQNIVDGSQPITVFNSLDKAIELFGDLDIPDFYNKTEIDAIGDGLSSLILNTYTKTEADNLLTGINLVECYTKAEIDTQ